MIIGTACVVAVKDKTALLVEIEDLRQVRDDLTQEVTRLTSDLEKERSKVHSLKGDIDKAKVTESFYTSLSQGLREEEEEDYRIGIYCGQ